jgi:hypothetical protein
MGSISGGRTRSPTLPDDSTISPLILGREEAVEIETVISRLRPDERTSPNELEN